MSRPFFVRDLPLLPPWWRLRQSWALIVVGALVGAAVGGLVGGRG